MWWNPEKLDASACRYLGLVCRLFSVIVSGAGEGPAAATCRELMKLLIQVPLTTRCWPQGRSAHNQTFQGFIFFAASH